MRDQRWRVAVIVLLGVVFVVVMSLLVGCFPGTAAPPEPAAPVSVRQGDSDGITERTVLLNDGREVVCLTWEEDPAFGGDGIAFSGMSCDWNRAEGTE